MKRFQIFAASATVLLVTLNPHPALTAETCRAVVQFDNDLWTVQSDGTPIRRLTLDGASIHPTRRDALWTPDGNAIVYVKSGQGRPVPMAAVDATTGTPLIEWETSKYTSFVAEMGWLESNILWVQSVEGKNGGSFEIWKFSNDFKKVQIRKSIAYLGSNCTFSPNQRYLACSASWGIDLYSTQKKRALDIDDEGLFNYRLPEPDDPAPPAVFDLGAPQAVFYPTTPVWSASGQRFAVLGTETVEKYTEVLQERGASIVLIERAGSGWLANRHYPLPEEYKGPIFSMRFTPDESTLIMEGTQRLYRYHFASGKLTYEPFTPPLAKPESLTVKLPGNVKLAKVLNWFCESYQVPGKGEEEEDDDED